MTYLSYQPHEYLWNADGTSPLRDGHGNRIEAPRITVTILEFEEGEAKIKTRIHIGGGERPGELNGLEDYTFFRRHILPRVLPMARIPEGAKFKWNWKAGCWCGCSPGFTVEGGADTRFSHCQRGRDIHVEYDFAKYIKGQKERGERDHE